ncbi:MAG: hypothetical protein SynsKO_31480 [Synoicihabitans sp.]
MKTLLIVPAMFASEGGIERLMRVVLKGLCTLAEESDEVALIALNDDQITPSRLDPYTNSRFTTALGMGGKKIRFFFRTVAACLRSDQIICGHIHLVSVIGLAQLLKPRLRVFQYAHGLEVWGPWKPLVKWWVHRKIVIIAVSDYTKRRVLERCPGLSVERIHVLPCSFDPSVAASTLSVPRVAGLILTVSRLSSEDRYKGVDQLIEAFPLIRKLYPAAHLRIIGKGNDRQRLENLALKTDHEHIEFAGFVPDEKLPSEFAQASIFALPSREEGFGIVYLEAFIHGTPSVAVRAGAAPEVVQPSVGELAEPHDLNDLAQACLRALERDWDRQKLVDHANSYAFPSFCERLREVLSPVQP